MSCSATLDLLEVPTCIRVLAILYFAVKDSECFVKSVLYR
jgi:hypothetical protein